VLEALVWPQRQPYKKTTARSRESIKNLSRPTYYAAARNGRSCRRGVRAEEIAANCGARVETDIR
jgi:hypothetical protein